MYWFEFHNRIKNYELGNYQKKYFYRINFIKWIYKKKTIVIKFLNLICGFYISLTKPTDL